MAESTKKEAPPPGNAAKDAKGQQSISVNLTSPINANVGGKLQFEGQEQNHYPEWGLVGASSDPGRFLVEHDPDYEYED